MLSSTFSKFGEVNLTVSGGAASPDFDDTPVVFARLAAGGVLINGRRATLADVSAAVEPFRRDGHARLLLSVSKDADAQGFVDVVHVLSALPNTRFAVLE
jgi:biopolymer transport protein ExbD